MLRKLMVLVALVVAVAAPAAAAVAGLSATVGFEKSMLSRTERPVVTFTIANDSREDVYLVRWQTPFQGIAADLFDVRRDGEPVQYTGRLAKRGTPGPNDYVLIAAGSARTIRLDLSKVYDFSRSGEYTVQYRVALQGALRDATPTAIGDFDELASNVDVAGVERNDRLPRFEQGRVTGAAASTSYVGCSSGNQSALSTARGNATTYSSGSLSYQNGHTASTAGPRYTTWFGSPTSSLYSTVTNHYSAILGAFQNAAITFDCSTCQSDPSYNNIYAYVYSTQPYKIYLCGAFWAAGATGTDSKAGTLVHEMSHFNVTAGTNDNAYGQTACKKLAQKSPRKAVDNADSHEYFAENNPAQN